MSSEEILIERLIHGDKKAFDRIYDMYVRRLMAFCRRIMHNEEDAEEVVQDVFVALWNNRGNLKNHTTLGPFLLASTRNRMLNEIRKKVNSPIFEEYVAVRELMSDSSASGQAEYADVRRAVLEAISSLPSTQRNVVTLSRLGSLSNREIMDRLGLSEQTVKNALYLGLKTLRQKLSGLRGDEMSLILLGAMQVYLNLKESYSSMEMLF